MAAIGQSASTSSSISSGSRNSFCFTDLELLQLKQEWSITNFASLIKLCKPGQCLRSASFKHQAYEEVSWQLCLYPGGKRDENKGFVSLFLKMYAPPTKEVCINAEYRLYFIGDNGEKKFTNVNVGEFFSRAGKRGFGWGLRNLPRTKVMSCLRKDGSLYIHCEVDLLPDLNRVSNVVMQNKSESSLREETVPDSFVKELGNLLASGSLADFEVMVGGTRIKVHKCILAAHSEVFDAMFDTDMTETSRGVLEIDDFSSEAVHQMLEYIYSGHASKMCDYAEELVGLADKYGLCDLKAMCERELAKRVAKDNVCHLVAVADLYRSSTLKKTCVSFISANKKDLMRSPSWSELRQENKGLCNDILEKIVVGNADQDEDGEAVPPPKRTRYALRN